MTPGTVTHQAPLSTGFLRQEYWNGLLFPPPGDLPSSGIEPTSLASPAMTGGFFTTAPPGKHGSFVYFTKTSSVPCVVPGELWVPNKCLLLLMKYELLFFPVSLSHDYAKPVDVASELRVLQDCLRYSGIP